MTETNFTAAQCRAGRALLDRTQKWLAREAGVGIVSLRKFEAGGLIGVENVVRLRDGLTGAGVKLVDGGVVL
jgi:hypothetical protein